MASFSIQESEAFLCLYASFATFSLSQLADMDARNIMFVAYTLMDLEGDTGH